MQISAKTNYACRALLELSIHWPNQEPLQIQAISERQGIPVKFLTQILITLKHIGFTQSVRGKKGGYLLAIPPSNINVADFLQKLGNHDFVLTVLQPDSDVITRLWGELDEFILEKMKDITFETLADRKRSLDQSMLFDI
jgi:Rrf2 family protein